jgi:hypothetical protein
MTKANSGWLRQSTAILLLIIIIVVGSVAVYYATLPSQTDPDSAGVKYFQGGKYATFDSRSKKKVFETIDFMEIRGYEVMDISTYGQYSAHYIVYFRIQEGIR